MRKPNFSTTALAAVLFLAPCFTATAQEANMQAKAPVATIKPHKLEKHGHVRTDNYFWLRERENPAVISYLEAENAYTKAKMAHTEELQETLFQEIKGRIKEDDSSVPYLQNGYYYYLRYDKGKEYAVYCRRKGSVDAPEEILLDSNTIGEGKGYFAIRGRTVSSANDIYAFAVDTVGRRLYTLQFKNLTTGKMLPDRIPGVTGNVAWASDNKTIFYAKQDPVTLRSYQIYRHKLGTDAAEDQLVFEEKDDTFSCYVWRTKSDKYLMIGSYQTLSSEIRFVDAATPEAEFRVIQPRERNHEYNVDHYADNFYIRTNSDARNFRLMKTPVTHTEKSHWQEIIGHREDVLLAGFELFNSHLVLAERKNGLMQIRIMSWDGMKDSYLDFGETAYLAYVSTNLEMASTRLRYGYTSMTTPNSTYEIDMNTHERTLLKQDEVLGDFDPDNYVTERMYARARDGIAIPISIVYRKGMKRDGSNPLLLYGYGSYGSSMDPSFRSSRLSLLDRGFIYAIAHIRGGQELGRPWYEDGKLLKKKNTFTDFIDSGRFLVDQRYTNPGKMYCMGGSAGGLLIGAVINMAPDLFHGAIAAVPWVDVVTTMLDDTIPLTTSEYDEWGNPNDKTYYDYMLSYSPYDNVEAKAYPHLLVTTGLHDSQVQYFEPTKWVAKMRAMKTDNNRLLLKTNMEAGHGGASGRFRRYRETALNYAFLLDLAAENRAVSQKVQ